MKELLFVAASVVLDASAVTRLLAVETVPQMQFRKQVILTWVVTYSMET